MQTIRIAAAQTPEFREDIGASLRYLRAVAEQAQAEHVSLLCFPECFLQGYLTDEASARRSALNLASASFRSLLDQLSNTSALIVIGMIEESEGHLFNTAAIVQNGTLLGRYRKQHLLKGESCFAAGTESPVFETAGLRFGINICNDTNYPAAVQKLAAQGASLIVCPANNMMRRNRAEKYKDLHNAVRSQRCRETALWLISSDVTGQQVECISWGPTAVINPHGEVKAQLPLGQTGLLVFDIPVSTNA
jgi:predicted amidohydrolase